jgi:hypothetical protein
VAQPCGFGVASGPYFLDAQPERGAVRPETPSYFHLEITRAAVRTPVTQIAKPERPGCFIPLLEDVVAPE